MVNKLSTLAVSFLLASCSNLLCFHLFLDHYNVSSDSWKSNKHTTSPAGLVCTNVTLFIIKRCLHHNHFKCRVCIYFESPWNWDDWNSALGGKKMWKTYSCLNDKNDLGLWCKKGSKLLNDQLFYFLFFFCKPWDIHDYHEINLFNFISGITWMTVLEQIFL